MPAAETEEKASKFINDKIDQSTVPGYADFVTMNADLQSDIPDTNVRARTALKSVTRMRSMTPQDILSSVEDRQRLLAIASEHLQANMSALLKDELASRDKQLASIQAERAKMETAITELRVRESTILDERSVIDADLRRKQEQLRVAAAAVAAQLTRDRDLIANNLN